MKTLIHVYLPILLTAFLITYLSTPIIRKLAIKWGLVDHPEDRKIHRNPIPILGGIAIYLGCIFSVLISINFNSTLFAIVAGASLIVFIGIIDDVFKISPWIKLAGQICCATVTFSLGIGIHFITDPFTGGVIYLGVFSFPLTVFWLVGMMNIMNLIDGLDGLASGVAAISAFILSLVAISTGQLSAAVLCIALLGANIGFLRYNFSPAQIFMGDSGSLFLGYILGIVSIIGVLKSTITISLAVPLLILGIPISDTVFAIVRRLKKGKAIFLPDNDHLHHKLIEFGFNQKQVVILLYIMSFGLGFIGFMLSLSSGSGAVIMLVCTVFIFGVSFLFLRKRYKKILSFLQLLL